MADNQKTIVIVEEKAFMGMFLAAVEAFTKFRPGKSRRPKETSAERQVFGMLFGQRMTRTDGQQIFNITLAVPNQVIKEQRVHGITASDAHLDRIRELTEVIPSYQFLGTFHGRPVKGISMWSSELSPIDERLAVEMAVKLTQPIIKIILAICCNNRDISASYVPHVAYHCTGDYIFTIGCYCANYYSKGEKKDFKTVKASFKPVDKFICRIATDINLGFDFGLHYDRNCPP